MASINDCFHNVSLFIANINKEPCDDPNLFPICDFGEDFFLDLQDENGVCTIRLWSPVRGIAGSIQSNIVENIGVVIDGTGKEVVEYQTYVDNIMDAIARWKEDAWRNNSIWLYNQFLGEEGLRRSLIHSLTIDDNYRQIATVGQKTVITQEFSIERGPFWESTEANDKTGNNREFSVFWGGIIDPEFAIGTTLGRICYNQVLDTYSSLVQDRILLDFWWGVKEDMGCGLDDWGPLMELEDGFIFAPNAAIVSEVGASPIGSPPPPNAVECLFGATAATVPRVGIELNDAFPGANFDQWRGSYIVLLRLRVDDPATEVEVVGRYGWRTSRIKEKMQTVPVDGADGTDWRLIELGVAYCPQDMGRYCMSDPTVDELGEWSIGVDVGRTAGGGTCYLDALYLIPYEHNAVLKNQNATTEFLNFQDVKFRFGTNEDYSVWGRYYTTVPGVVPVSPDTDYVISTEGLGLSHKGNRIVAVGQTLDRTIPASPVIVQDLLVLWNQERITYPSWLSLRDEASDSTT